MFREFFVEIEIFFHWRKSIRHNQYWLWCIAKVHMKMSSAKAEAILSWPQCVKLLELHVKDVYKISTKILNFLVIY